MHNRISDSSGQTGPLPELLRIVLGLGCDYVRWIVLTPMVVVWAVYLLMILVMAFVNFEDSFQQGMERGYEYWREWVGPVDWIENELVAAEQDSPASGVEPAEPQSLRFTDEDLMPWIMKGWGMIALLAWLLSMLRGLLFGLRPPRTLKQKIRLAMLADLVGWVLLFLVYFFGNATYQGGFFVWFALFSGSAIFVALVSIVILTLGHVLAQLQDQLFPQRRDLGHVP